MLVILIKKLLIVKMSLNQWHFPDRLRGRGNYLDLGKGNYTTGANSNSYLHGKAAVYYSITHAKLKKQKFTYLFKHIVLQFWSWWCKKYMQNSMYVTQGIFDKYFHVCKQLFLGQSIYISFVSHLFIRH